MQNPTATRPTPACQCLFLLALLGLCGGPATQASAEASFSDFLGRSRVSHWAFRPVEKPLPPVVSRPDWIRSPVDAFVLARLDRADLGPSPSADRRTLIRRLSFDLRGLPPSPEEVRAFVADDRADAYDRLIDAFLASPQYGECWGRHWLDVARYADTKGYVFEESRRFPYAYTYRDYVIRAFNEDLSYNRFILEQLAADRLDLGADKRPLAALGFLTLGRRFLNRQDDIIDDRIDVVSRGLLGMTVSCARCHDHKFDPIQATDYYALYGVFRSSEAPDILPLISEPNTEDPQYQAFAKRLSELQEALNDYERQVHRELLIETREKLGAYLLAAQDALAIEEDTAFKTLAKEREVRHRVLRPWVDFLKRQLKEPDAIFKAYAWFHALSPDDFDECGQAVVERIRTEPGMNSHIRAAFDRVPPASMTEVMQRYIEVLQEVDGQWRTRLDQGVASDTQDAIDCEDEAAALQRLAFGPDSPGHISARMAYRLSDTPQQQQVRAKRRAVAEHEATHTGRPDRAMVLNDADSLFDPFVFLRGRSDNRGESVARRFLQVLSNGSPTPFADGSGRLDLARAIADPNNPLTARVLVNRVWLHHFGRALVDTPSDFGLRSDPPTHPALLDFLAASFMEQGWSIKALHRMILRSNAYRQVSDTHPEGRKKDIENRLVWRQNRRRLDFEAMRDALLSVSGEIDLKRGGPGESLTDDPVTLRRTVYGLVERQNMAGFIKNFDFASPDTHCPKRYHTIVPQQSLFLMNSPFVIARACALERSVRGTDGDCEEARINRLYNLCFQRPPRADEVDRLTTFLDRDDIVAGPPKSPVVWHYGYGSVDPQTGRTADFISFDVYRENRWQPRKTFPHDELGYVSLHQRGGHPGRDPRHAAILRWVVPQPGRIAISGALAHPADKGDGVIATVISSRRGRLAEHVVFNRDQSITLEDIVVQAGDTIDLVVSPGPTDSYDSYSATLRIRMDHTPTAGAEDMRLSWNSEADFAGPRPAPPEPLSPWGQLAQVLLLTNEFMYVD